MNKKLLGFFNIDLKVIFNSLLKDKFLTCPNSKSLQMTILSLKKMLESYPKGRKTLWEKEKWLIMSNFSFSHRVFKSLIHWTHVNLGLFGKG